MPARDHWDRVYATRPADAVSWYQRHATTSLRLIREARPDRTAAVVDVGGGASTLAEDLLADGYTDLTVLDVSGGALDLARARLGERAPCVRWLQADITAVALPAARFDLWHDRAVFHFLTEAADRRSYVRAVLSAVRPGGSVIVATFAADGPRACSGLSVVGYDPEALHDEFGAAFTLQHHERERHTTPLGAVQQFTWCLCRRASPEAAPGPRSPGSAPGSRRGSA